MLEGKPLKLCHKGDETMSKTQKQVSDRIVEARHERMLRWFEYAHLPERLKEVSRPFCELAVQICLLVQQGPERTVALRKLLESKDAAVRAKLEEL
jgi:hypothetical protein